MLVIIASGLLIIDQITKFAVRSRMEIGETLPVFRGVLDFTYVQNFACNNNDSRGAILIAPTKEKREARRAWCASDNVWRYWESH